MHITIGCPNIIKWNLLLEKPVSEIRVVKPDGTGTLFCLVTEEAVQVWSGTAYVMKLGTAPLSPLHLDSDLQLTVLWQKDATGLAVCSEHGLTFYQLRPPREDEAESMGLFDMAAYPSAPWEDTPPAQPKPVMLEQVLEVDEQSLGGSISAVCLSRFSQRISVMVCSSPLENTSADTTLSQNGSSHFEKENGAKISGAESSLCILSWAGKQEGTFPLEWDRNFTTDNENGEMKRGSVEGVVSASYLDALQLYVMVLQDGQVVLGCIGEEAFQLRPLGLEGARKVIFRQSNIPPYVICVALDSGTLKLLMLSDLMLRVKTRDSSFGHTIPKNSVEGQADKLAGLEISIIKELDIMKSQFYSGCSSAKITSMAFSQQGYTLAVSYENLGFSLWDVAEGRQGVSSLLPREHFKKERQDQMGTRSSGIAWINSDYNLLVFGIGTNHFPSSPAGIHELPPDVQPYGGSSLMLFKLFRSASTSFCKAPFTFQGDQEIIFLQSNPWVPGEKVWQRLPVQKTYAASNRPMRHVSVSDINHHVVVAGSRGFALYNSIMQKWRVFGDVNQESELCVLGLCWWGEDAVVAVAREVCDGEAGGAYGPLAIRVYPRTHLDSLSMPCSPVQLPVGFKPYFIKGALEADKSDIGKSDKPKPPVLLLLIAGTNSFLLYRLSCNGSLLKGVPDRVSISLLGEGPVPNAPVRMPSEKLTFVPCFPVDVLLLPDIHPRQLAIVDHSGQLLLMEITNRRTRVVLESGALGVVQLSGPSGIWPPSLPPAFLIVCRTGFEIWMPSITHRGSEDLNESLLDSSNKEENVRVSWFAELEEDLHKHDLEGFSASLGFLAQCGLEISVEQDTSSMQTDRMSSPYYILKTRKISITHYVMYKLLLLNRTMKYHIEMSSDIDKSKNQDYLLMVWDNMLMELANFHLQNNFSQALASFGFLISMGLEYFYESTKRQGDMGSGNEEAQALTKTLLLDTLALVQDLLPNHFHEVLGNAIRKSEPSRLPLLFSLHLENGMPLTPVYIFDDCFRSNNLLIASWYLPLMTEGELDSLPVQIYNFMKQHDWRFGISHALSCRLFWECLVQMENNLLHQMFQYTSKTEEIEGEKRKRENSIPGPYECSNKDTSNRESNKYSVPYMGTTLGEVLSRFFWKQFQKGAVEAILKVFVTLSGEDCENADFILSLLQKSPRSMIESMDTSDEGMQVLLSSFLECQGQGQSHFEFYTNLSEVVVAEKSSTVDNEMADDCKIPSIQNGNDSLSSTQRNLQSLRILLDISMGVFHVEGMLVFASLLMRKNVIVDCFNNSSHLPLKNAYARFISDFHSLGDIVNYSQFGVAICLEYANANKLQKKRW